MPLSATETYVLQLIAAQSSDAPVPNITQEEWPAVQTELLAQGVIAYPANAVSQLDLTADQKNQYLAYVGRTVSNWYSLMSAQNKVLRAFRHANIPVVVLKGAAAAVNYAQPTNRAMGDIDLIAPPDHFDQAFALMENLGWENNQTLELYPRHAGFEKAGCPEVELHRYFSSCTDKQQAEALDQGVYAGIAIAEWQEVGGFSVPVLPPLANGLVLLAHINQHLTSGLGLRQILDWQSFAEKHLDDALWESQFKQAAQAIGMEKLAVTTTALCSQHLGLQTNATWFNDADSNLANDFLEYIMARGNMGRKGDPGDQKARTVLHNFRSPAAIIRYLYSGGRAHWAPAQKHAWLAPAACIYQVGHIARMGMKHKMSFSDLANSARSSQSEVDLLQRLGVTRL